MIMNRAVDFARRRALFGRYSLRGLLCALTLISCVLDLNQAKADEHFADNRARFSAQKLSVSAAPMG